MTTEKAHIEMCGSVVVDGREVPGCWIEREDEATEKAQGARCPGCGHPCCPFPGLECGGESDAVRACDLPTVDIAQVVRDVLADHIWTPLKRGSSECWSANDRECGEWFTTGGEYRSHVAALIRDALTSPGLTTDAQDGDRP